MEILKWGPYIYIWSVTGPDWTVQYGLAHTIPIRIDFGTWSGPDRTRPDQNGLMVRPSLTKHFKERNKKDMFDPVVGQIMRIYGYFVMKKLGIHIQVSTEGLRQSLRPSTSEEAWSYYMYLVFGHFKIFLHSLWFPLGGARVTSNATNGIIDVSTCSQTNTTKNFGGDSKVFRRR